MRKFPRAKRQNKKATTDEILSPSFLAKRAPGRQVRQKAGGLGAFGWIRNASGT